MMSMMMHLAKSFRPNGAPDAFAHAEFDTFEKIGAGTEGDDVVDKERDLHGDEATEVQRQAGKVGCVLQDEGEDRRELIDEVGKKANK